MLKKVINVVSKILFYLFVIILLILTILSFYIKNNFDDVGFEQLIYSIMNFEGTGKNVISSGTIYVLVRFTIILTIYLVIKFIYMKNKYNCSLNISYKSKSIDIHILPIPKVLIALVIIYIFIISIYNYKLIDYIKYITNYSNVIGEYYVDPKKVQIDFPENKKNLIFIYVESLESTNVSKLNGGVFSESIIPNLEELALDNINFSNTKKLGGAYQLDGTGWTMAAMVGYSTGIPLKVPADGNGFNIKNGFLSGTYSIGEILEQKGYKNYIMFGSKASFAGRDIFYKQHGNYAIYDYKWAKKEKIIPKDYKEWWGYEDSKLFEFAKEKLESISENDEPFNFTILTADTHFTDGYIDKKCEKKFDNHYANSFYCSDYLISSFVEWIQNQDFYDDTVIIIVGDHLTMQKDFYNISDNNYTRTIYNTIINSEISPQKEKNRTFTTLDFYPTTLAALGCEIKGEQLGLGVSLYSKKKTIPEKIGFEYFSDELNKNSKFYNKSLLGYDNYYKLKGAK